MNANSSNKHLKLVGYVLHHIDIEGQTCVYSPPPDESEAFREYLLSLLEEVQFSKQKRAYELDQADSIFCTALRELSLDTQAIKKESTEQLARHLLAVETDAEEKYGHLAKNGLSHIKKGSFLQCLYLADKKLQYLAVKIEHESLIDESDFIRRFGLGESRKLYKACMVLFNEENAPIDFSVYDTNKNPSAYWTKSMFGLRVVRDDEENTKVAVNKVVTALGRIKKDSLIDYNILRNASIAAFKKTGVMNFDKFVEDVFAAYEPHSDSLKGKWSEVVERISKLADKGEFDGQFNLVPSAVRFKIKRIRLDPQMELVYEEGTIDLESKVWASKTKDGRNVLVIDAPDAIGQFQFKEW